MFDLTASAAAADAKNFADKTTTGGQDNPNTAAATSHSPKAKRSLGSALLAAQE